MTSKLKKNSVFTYNVSNPLLDQINLQLLQLLQENPRLTMSELARQVGMSSPAVSERVKRLEEAKVIRGYAILFDPQALGLPLSAYVRLRPHTGRLAEIVELAQSIPEIVECHRITGDDCFILKIHFPAMDQLDRLLDRFMIYGNTTTSIIQSSPVVARGLPLPS